MQIFGCYFLKDTRRPLSFGVETVVWMITKELGDDNQRRIEHYNLSSVPRWWKIVEQSGSPPGVKITNIQAALANQEDTRSVRGVMMDCR